MNRSRRERRGITLLEVLISLVIFLIALAGLVQLTNIGADRANEIRWRAEANRHAAAKLAEIAAGSISPDGSGTIEVENPEDLAPTWNWESSSEQEGTKNLLKITVRVYRDASGETQQVTLQQWIYDPAQRGALGLTSSTTNQTTQPQ